MIHLPFHLNAYHDAGIHGDIRMPDEGEAPIILIIHGFRGSKDWGFFPYIAQEFVKSGAITISWNMSLNGYSKDATYIDKPDDFAKNTVTQELADTNLIISALQDTSSDLYSLIASRWNGTLMMIGHSRGAGIAILSAEKNPCIHTLALWNPISKFGRFSERQKNIWKETGIFQVDETNAGIPVMMNYSYIEDLELHREEYSLLRSMQELTCEVLIVHAEQDMTVPLREARILQEHAMHSRLEVVPATGHIFGCTHPFTESTPALNKALNFTIDFFDL
ncbi:MAG: hypothetical protein FJ212_01540 [Ignavibacteria bacterium]|nr:hypothetical protein [Ignavibacteria bacterium]